MIIDLQNSDTWEIQLTITINFIFSKDAKKERVMHSKSNNEKFTNFTDANEVVDKLFECLSNFVHDIKEIWKRQWEKVIILLIQFNWCITNAIK